MKSLPDTDAMPEKTQPTVAMPPIIPVQPTNPADSPRSSSHWQLKLVIGLILLGLIGWGSRLAYQLGQQKILPKTDQKPNSTTNQANSEPTNQSPQTATACANLEITNVPEQAMSYGVPKGWIAEATGDTIAIMEDKRNLTAAFIYTAQLKQNLSASDFLKQFADIFKQTIEDAGGQFSSDPPTESHAVATAVARATVAEGDLTGLFTVEKTASLVTLKVYWAPVAEFSIKQAQLKNVVDCFTRHTILTDAELAAATQAKTSGTTPSSPASSVGQWGSLITGQKNSFTYRAPASWTARVQSSAGDSPVTTLTLDAPAQDASVAFVYNLNRYGVSEPEQFAQLNLQTFGIQATVANHQNLGNNIDSFEFTGSFGSKAVQGTVVIQVQPYQTFYAHYVGVMIANADKWSSYAPILNQIQTSIRLTDAGQELSSLPSLPSYTVESLGGSAITSSDRYKQTVEDRSSQKWSDAMRGYEDVTSPTTGQHYDAPLNSYNSAGPDGAGYYRQLPGGTGLEKLTPATP